MNARIVGLLTLLGAAACVGPDEQVEIVIDGLVHPVGEYVRYDAVNLTSRPVFFFTCGGTPARVVPEVWMLNGDRWVIHAIVCAFAGPGAQGPIRLEPGESIRDSTNMFPAAGVYMIRLTYMLDPDAPGIDTVFSRQFHVR